MGSRARQTVREESWDSLHYSEASNASSRDEASEGDNVEGLGSPTFLTVGDVQRAIHPLQATADRVGKQVERFAESLDRLSSKTQHKFENSCDHVLPLVAEYEGIASRTVDRLRKVYAPGKLNKSPKGYKRKDRGSSGRSTPIPIHEDGDEIGLSNTTIEDLYQWEQECQTWRLLSLMLQAEYPTKEALPSDMWYNGKLKRPASRSPTHRYSSEHDIWQTFLAEDDSAWEKHTVLEWLKTSAESSGEEIETVVEELELGSDRGAGLNPQGWLFSRSEIKKHKMLRVWPKPLDPSSPGMDTSLVNPDRTKRLVSQLDPDVFSRQARSLREEDVFFERAQWRACWEMIRRGRSWKTIREWCQTRKDGWRALCIYGDARTSEHGTWQSRILWRRMCVKAAKLGGIDEYERAVYGVLGGDLSTVEKVARGCDDFLFAHYNSYLLRSFDNFLERRFSSTDGSICLPVLTTSDSIQEMSSTQIVDKMLRTELFEAEAKNPLKSLQASLISKRFGVFIQDQGQKWAQLANKAEQSKTMDKSELQSTAPTFAADVTLESYDLLRILTHMIFIFQEIDPIIYKSSAVENIIVAYVDYLGIAGKQQLLPLYASRLSSARAIQCMARQLPFITDSRERKTTVQLMKQYKMNVKNVLNMQLILIILDMQGPEAENSNYPRPVILDYDYKNEGPKSMKPVKRGFIGRSINGDEQDVINAFEWYLLLDGLWQETMRSGTILYQYLLGKSLYHKCRGCKADNHTAMAESGRLAAARQLSKTVTFSMISLNKTEKLLGRSIDIANSQNTSEDEYNEYNDEYAMRRSTRSRSNSVRQRRGSSSRRRLQAEREVLLDHGGTFLGFENLMVALDALEHWKDIEAQAKTLPDVRHNKSWKKEIQTAHDAVVASMQPLLHGWLQYPKDDAEARAIEKIKTGYLPEMILAYNSVLLYGGHMISREVLLQCMDLAATVAAEHSDLADIFVRAGRMSELVDSMAIASKSILSAAENGQLTGRKWKKINGASMDIWSVKGASE
ncbi:Nucleoporin nup84 [Xylographa soralifera]|nr:Nucleoporin nup84 [Xylographa soralifera]